MYAVPPVLETEVYSRLHDAIHRPEKLSAWRQLLKERLSADDQHACATCLLIESEMTKWAKIVKAV